MLSEKPHDAADDQRARLEAWRKQREKTFDAWLEHNHREIMKIAGCNGLEFLANGRGLVIHLTVANGQEEVDRINEVRTILTRAIEEGFIIDWQSVELAFKRNQSLVRLTPPGEVSTPSRTEPTSSQEPPTQDPSSPSPRHHRQGDEWML